MNIGVISDLHLYRKTSRVARALSTLKAQAIDVLLIVGDLADRGTSEQYDLLYDCLQKYLPTVPIFCVTGNHDNSALDDHNYRQFEKRINPTSTQYVHESGAFAVRFNETVDIFGLNPVYHQKVFWFPNRGAQLQFLEDSLAQSPCKFHIILCHPPLIEHNPQRMAGEKAYIVREQDERLQNLINDTPNAIFISGHTHCPPTVEKCANQVVYVNDGCVCKTTVDGKEAIGLGNVCVIHIAEDKLEVRVIHLEEI